MKIPISRHRLPHPYRSLLVIFWLLPIALLMATAVIGSGEVIKIVDLRFLLPLAMMVLPAWYVWQEGVDVLPEGLRIRVYVPHYQPYEQLMTWRLARVRGDCILTIWDETRRKVLECHAGHLSDLPELLRALKDHLPTDPTSHAACR